MNSLSSVVVGLTLVLLPLSASAQATDNSALIAVLLKQVAVLQQKLQALILQQTQNATFPAKKTFTTPSGTVVDEYGNTVTLPAELALQRALEALRPPVNPLYKNGAANLQAALYAIPSSECAGSALVVCEQKAKDALLQAKYTILGNTAEADITGLLSLAKDRFTGFQGLQRGEATMGTSRIRRDNAQKYAGIVSQLQQIIKILELRVW